MPKLFYTLDEAKYEIIKLECAEGGHVPSNHISTVGDPVGVWYCDCDSVKWVPSA